jgi:hypothetical protein
MIGAGNAPERPVVNFLRIVMTVTVGAEEVDDTGLPAFT